MSAGAVADLAPASLIHLDAVDCRSFQDPLPCGVALVVGHVLDLIEARDGGADVPGVLDRRLALAWKSEFARRKLVPFLAVEPGHGAPPDRHQQTGRRSVTRSAPARPR